MQIETQIPLLEDLLGAWREALGPDFQPYRNHVYRMAHFCFALRECSADERHKILIAGCFHDLGIWSDKTVDYLPPSVLRAREYLAANGLQAWSEEIELMIDQHHKLRAYRDPRFPLVEVFRKADLVDVSLGMVRLGVPKRILREVRAAFPNSGFHKRLMRLAGEWFGAHPLSAPPFFKW
ncbi:MAG TPA: hypothetical protein VGE51_09535 [Fontimonas sp.]